MAMGAGENDNLMQCLVKILGAIDKLEIKLHFDNMQNTNKTL